MCAPKRLQLSTFTSHSKSWTKNQLLPPYIL